MRLTVDTTHLSVVAASSCTVNGTAHYRDYNRRTGQVTYGRQDFALTGTTVVAVAAAPDPGVEREILAITCAESAGTPAAETLTFAIATLSGSTYTQTTELFKAALATGAEVVEYAPGTGWLVYTAEGNIFAQVAA